MSKRAIVTGASSGIGRETAKQLAAEGWTVFAVARRNDRLDSLHDESPDHIIAHVADITADGAADEVIAAAQGAMGGIDLLVNNAGTTWVGPFADMPADEIDLIVDLNEKALYRMCLAAIPALERSGSGQIINVGSVAAHIAMGTIAVYCASKAAVVMFSRVLARDLKDKGIRVNVLSPAGTNTEIFEKTGTDASNFMPAADVARTLVDLTKLPDTVDVLEHVIEQRLQPIM